jgi:hypothetical protein
MVVVMSSRVYLVWKSSHPQRKENMFLVSSWNPSVCLEFSLYLFSVSRYYWAMMHNQKFLPFKSTGVIFLICVVLYSFLFLKCFYIYYLSFYHNLKVNTSTYNSFHTNMSWATVYVTHIILTLILWAKYYYYPLGGGFLQHLKFCDLVGGVS